MKLLDALEALKECPRPDSPVLDVRLACSFTPLHFLTYLKAHLHREFPDHNILAETGIFGDLPGNLQQLEAGQHAFVVAIIEWADLDPRLGIRLLGGWEPRRLPDILQNARDQAERLAAGIESVARHNTVTVVTPTLPLPPAAFAPGWMVTTFEAELLATVASMAARMSHIPGVRLVSPQRLDRVSPPATRFDVKSELNSGFPYTLSHADELAGLIAHILRDVPPKKGIITDLDNTFWMGVLGEVYVEGISWDLDHHSLRHGLYQQMLASLAEAGTLIGVASKNDEAYVEEAFRKTKPLLPRDRIFPLEANWGPKSASVGRILQAWNIAADSVVFIDDSPLDLAEVQAAYPQMECLLFPRTDDKAAYQLLEHLRDTFGRMTVSAEDEIRLDSIRASQAISDATQAQGYTPEKFLREAEGELTVSFIKESPDPRALELLNKTNQFNLNGRRHTESSWQQYLAAPGAFLCLAAYQDKFGPLGKIAVLAGHVESNGIFVDHWVMSCRAFSRRIEHACLLHLLRKFGEQPVTFDFVPTERNGPLRDFFATLIGAEPKTEFTLSPQQVRQNCPEVFLQTKEHASE